MASVNILVAFAIFVVAFPSTSATEFVVGDALGWRLGVDYRAWASGKTFVVGDTLVFNYTGTHSVVIVNEINYQQCTVPTGAAPLTSGDDVITLATSGSQWYICGIPLHCPSGMKLAITVSPAGSAIPVGSPSSTSGAGSPPPPPPPAGTTAPPPSAAAGMAFSRCHAWFVGALSILMMIMA
ncbi:blue copper protein 1b-like [Rhododendron vialii]|uniref:blue copper protein 1b-like n=1 Tax=Rhododendron vialii TaxID=182163 RepID=UPI00265E21D0|nr:blue copper protein 1b-like [Rhododendron vialii]